MSFSKRWNCKSPSVILAFWKNYKCKLISNSTRKTVWLLLIIKTWKNSREEVPQDLSWSHLFALDKTFFNVSVQSFLSSFYLISLAYKNSHSLYANHNSELVFNMELICTSVILKKSKLREPDRASAIVELFKTQTGKLTTYWTSKRFDYMLIIYWN